MAQKENPKTVGERSEAVIIAKFLLLGEVVLRPFGDNQRYDLVLDRGGKFFRVQCKTGRLKNGTVEFNSCSNSGGYGKKSYFGEIEFFAVYCPDNGEVYLVPVEIAAGTLTRLRIAKPVNNSCITKIRWAQDYILG